MLQSTPGSISHPGILERHPYRAAKSSSLCASWFQTFVSILEQWLVFIKIIFCKLDIKAVKQLEFIKLPSLERNITHLTVSLAAELSSWLILLIKLFTVFSQLCEDLTDLNLGTLLPVCFSSVSFFCYCCLSILKVFFCEIIWNLFPRKSEQLWTTVVCSYENKETGIICHSNLFH